MMDGEPIHGVTADISEKMLAVGARVLTEDGLMMRECEHGILHPVDHLHRQMRSVEERLDERERLFRHRLSSGFRDTYTECTCRCCEAWIGDMPVDTRTRITPNQQLPAPTDRLGRIR